MGYTLIFSNLQICSVSTLFRNVIALRVSRSAATQSDAHVLRICRHDLCTCNLQTRTTNLRVRTASTSGQHIEQYIKSNNQERADWRKPRKAKEQQQKETSGQRPAKIRSSITQYG
eukprot:6207915-Pleurochrysis_carterae.AAC.1